MNIRQLYGVEPPEVIHRGYVYTPIDGVPKKVTEEISRILIGVEVEIERAGFDMPYPASDYWLQKEDHSLRNGGMEYITHLGLRQGSICTAIYHLFNHFQVIRETLGKNLLTFTERCSIHVHLNVQDFTEEEIENFIVLYTLFEAPLFAYCSPERRNNVFAVPLRDSVICLGPADHKKGILGTIDKFSKYCAFNCEAIRRFGTVEFRHHEGTKSKEKILHWINLLALMHNYAKNTPNQKLRDALFKMKCESSYEEFTKSVFYSLAPTILRGFVPLDMDLAISDAKSFFVGD